jgi:hypothetical protein
VGARFFRSRITSREICLTSHMSVRRALLVGLAAVAELWVAFGNVERAQAQSGVPFSLQAVRAQLSDQATAPSVTSARSGQKIWVRVIVRVNTKLVGPVACVAFAMRSAGKELDRDCNEDMRGSSFGEPGGTLGFTFPVTVRLGANQTQDVLDITAWVTAHGITQRGRTSVAFYR